ncbi:response regulator transcription factor [Clostridium tagluense]|uniref:response regulator transcription factor n=1 Tax=Clostridium tagluense TaxID=360422 RepID=UPI001CF39173|nr:response regulator transcription factor [Clostridium tagluense]MCB2300816.1 response regulator transcription factor [Clostridium tagluense]
MTIKYNVLIADDEKDIIKVLRLFLEKEEINIYETYDGEMAYMFFQNHELDLIIVDIMMPRMNGYELIKKIRKEKDIPIVIISGKVQLDERILGLDLGAVDYIVKPFEPLEVVARVRAQLRRLNKSEHNQKHEILKYGTMELDKEKCIIQIDENTVDVTKTELAIIEALMKRPGKVFTKEELYECAWGDTSYVVDDNTIRVTISRLREKIGEKRIKTIRGLGYRLEKNE